MAMINHVQKPILILLFSLFGFFSVQAQSLEITKITPASGAADSEITIYGTGFDASSSDNTVTFTPGGGGTGTTATVTGGSSNHLTVTVPSGLTGGNYNIGVERASDGSTAGFPLLFDVAGGGGDFGDPASSQKIISDTADFIQSVFPADLDGDGDQDIATANAPFGGGSEISWYKNDGSGNFDPEIQISNAVDRSHSVIAADLDGDGDLDLVSASEGDSKIAWYENNGSGSFGSQQVITSFSSADRVAAAGDLDGDGDIDLVSGNDEIVWYENDGAASPAFTEKTVSTNVSLAKAVIAVDLDGDHDLDIVSASSSSDQIGWFENADGDGNFSSKTTIFYDADGVRDIHASDLDGDGDQDLISAVYNDNIVGWYENDGSGDFGNEFSSSTQKEISTTADGVWTVSTADLDADGDMDVIAGTNNGDKIIWFDNNGSASFGSGQDISTSAEGARSVTAADFNNDGSIDVASASAFDDKVSWYENITADPVQITKIQPINGSPNTNIRIYGPEFTGSQSNFEVTFTPANGAGETGTVEDSVGEGVIYAKVPSGLTGSNYKINVERVDDGSKDTYFRLFGVATSGGSNFSDRMEIDEFNSDDGTLTIADLDDDGHLDVLGENGWYANDGDANFGDAQSTSSIDYDELLENYADFNGDGNLDRVFYNNSKISWDENHGDGSSTTHIIEEVDNVEGPIIASDFNEDGSLDILAFTTAERFNNLTISAITIYQNNGSGSFTVDGVEDVYIIEAEIPDIQDLHAADIDNDGDMDIALASSEEGSEPDVAWLENGLKLEESSSGTGPIGGITSKISASNSNIQNADTISFGDANAVGDFDDEGAWSVTSADINGDGQLDLIAIGHDDGEVAWFENTGGEGENKFGDKQVISRKAIGGLSVEAGDLDGDGDMDIVTSSDYKIGESDRTDILGWYENTPNGPASPVADGASRSISDGAINIKQNDTYEDLSSFTLELWFKTTYSGDNQQGIIEHYTESLPLSNNSNDSGWYLLEPFGSDNLSFRIELSPQFLELTTETSIEANQWYHVAMVYEYNTSNPASPYSSLNLYINGKKDNAEATGGGTGNVDNGLYGIVVGELRSAVNSQFQGNINELRMWSTARTKEEIRNNMFEELNGDEAGLIGYWPMDDGNGRQVADLTSNDNHGTQSGDTQFSNSTSPWGITITGSEGWRTMSSPANNDSYKQILQGLWTQGFSGASSEEGAANVLTWNPGTQSWNPPNDISDVPNAGEGFIIYVYDDQDFDNVDDDFPKPIWTNDPREDGEISPSITHYDDGDAETNDDGWNLVGNPYQSTIDWSAGTGWTRTNLDGAFYVWNNEIGDYQSHNGSAGTLPNDLIAPWQGFWVQSSSGSPELTMTADIQASGGSFLKQNPIPTIKFEVKEITKDHPASLSSRTVLMLHDQAKAGKDYLDAWKIESLHKDYLSLFTASKEGYALDINALPVHLETITEIDLGLKGSNLGGNYQLAWDHNTIPEGWKFILQNNKTGQIINLVEADSIRFQLPNNSGNKASKVLSDDQRTSIKAPTPIGRPAVAKEEHQAPFTLQILPGQQVSNDLTQDLPENISLQQNYPNPFNPSTVIRYQLPVRTPVEIAVFDLLGQEIAKLVNEPKEAGYHTVTFDAGNLASGLYLYRLKAGNTVITKKLTLIK
jgi:hypothetical protein